MERRTFIAGSLGLAGFALLVASQQDRLRGALNTAYARSRPNRTLDEALRLFGPDARQRLKARFKAAGFAYPPRAVTLIGLKAEKRLELWAEGDHGPHLIADWPVLAASGGPGPKLKEGDRQVPEGIYPITYLNPNSLYHLSLRIGYPGTEDRAHARAEGRTGLGGDIMIHGPGGSIGCVSISEAAVEEVFVLAADIGIAQTRILLTPHDSRAGPPLKARHRDPEWLQARYDRLHTELAKYAT